MDPEEVASECASSFSTENCGALPSTPRRWYKKNKSGRVICSCGREMIRNAYVRLRHLHPERSVEETAATVSDLLGVSVSLVMDVKKEMKNNDGNVATPSRKRPRSAGKRRRTEVYDDFTKCALRSSVHRFFRSNEIPTVKAIAADFNASGDVTPLKPWTVRRLLNDIGFRYEKRGRNSLLIERDDIVAWQQKYLYDVARYRMEGRKIFYLDETWVNAGHTLSTVWTDTTVASHHDAFMRGLTTGLKQPSGKGQRLIVTHIGSEDGFVSGCLDIFRGTKTGDYHEEMDGTRFERWFGAVLPQLPQGSVIVMDNASYHSRLEEAVPTTSSRKQVVQDWLTSKGLAWDEKMLKKELLSLVTSVKTRYIKYRVDGAAERAGCIVLRLPPYHCELNPIELIWAQMKRGVAARNATFKLADVEVLLREEAAKVTAQHWANAVQHVISIETKFRGDGGASAHVQPIIIHLDEDDMDSDSDLSGIESFEDV